MRLFWIVSHRLTLAASATNQYITIYRQTSNIRHTKSQNLNVSYLVLQLSLPYPLKPGVNLRMNIYIWVINFIAYKGVAYISDLWPTHFF